MYSFALSAEKYAGCSNKENGNVIICDYRVREAVPIIENRQGNGNGQDVSRGRMESLQWMKTHGQNLRRK